MDPTIQAALIASISSICGFIVGFIGVILGAVVTFSSTIYLSHRQEEQQKLQLKVEQDKWLKDKLQEIYSNCLFYVNNSGYFNLIPGEVQQESILKYKELEFESRKLDFAFDKEREKWLNLLLIYHPVRGTNEFETFLTKFREGNISAIDIRDLAAHDPRLRTDIGK